MEKLMLINVVDVGEMRIAIVEDGVLEELYIERASREQLVGNIYKGKVVNIEPSIQAAFVDFGAARNAFLHISDVIPSCYMVRPDGTRATPRGGHEYPPIHAVLRRGQELLIQITKDPIGTKGPSATTYISLAGRYLVMMPNVRHHGISRKITDEDERQRLRQILSEMNLPPNMGFIVRTAGAGRTKSDLVKDLAHLQNLWKVISERIKESKPGDLIYRESDLVIRTIRDLFTPDINKIIIDSQPEYERARDFLKTFMPRYQRVLHLYTDPQPLFHRYKIEEEIERIRQRKVNLPMGGAIVIDQTEALVAIDVNSGKIKHETDPEETAFRTNMAAAPEIARQLRLRDLGGIIICDFIDMRSPKHIRAVEKALADALKRDRARTKVLRMSRFGIIEMTRQRVRTSLLQASSEHCPYCGGAGQIKSPETVSLEVIREIRAQLTNPTARGIEVIVNPRVAHYLQNELRRELVRLEDTFQKYIRITGREEFTPEKVETKIIREEAALPPAPPSRELFIPPEVKAASVTQESPEGEPQEKSHAQPPPQDQHESSDSDHRRRRGGRRHRRPGGPPLQSPTNSGQMDPTSPTAPSSAENAQHEGPRQTQPPNSLEQDEKPPESETSNEEEEV